MNSLKNLSWKTALKLGYELQEVRASQPKGSSTGDNPGRRNNVEKTEAGKFDKLKGIHFGDLKIGLDGESEKIFMYLRLC